jgi:mannose-6-phosphate isomerase-like protein (cupin superfamily)
MGLSVLISTGMRRKRVPERLRLALYSWLYDDENDKENSLSKRLRKPTKVTDVEAKTLGAEGVETDGVRRELLSPATALTSNLYVVVLTIPSGKELVAQKAQGVEFYYVIHGIGVFASGDDTTSDISKGDAFVVDPGRCVKVKTKMESTKSKSDLSLVSSNFLCSVLVIIVCAALLAGDEVNWFCFGQQRLKQAWQRTMIRPASLRTSNQRPWPCFQAV